MDSETAAAEAETSDENIAFVDRYDPAKKKNAFVKRYNPERKKKKEKPVPECKTTSWEVYNIFLRKLVDQLIDLGASKQIKIVAFQLWASYLRLSNVAFVSKDKKKLPALSLAFRNSDAKNLYGVENLRKRIFTRKRKREKSNLSNIKSEDEASNQKNDVEPGERDLFDSSGADCSSQSTQKNGMVFQAFTSQQLEEISGEMTESCDRLGRHKMTQKTRTQMKRLVHDRRVCNEPLKCPSSPVTIVSIITIIRVALQLVGDEIYLSDILRWICEGRISFIQSHKKILAYNPNIGNDLVNMKWSGFMTDIRNFTRALDLKKLPTPNLFHLAERYCEDLNLPNDILQMVLKLMTVTEVTMDYSKYNFVSFPDYECRVMAFIIFALKLTFALDDVTEHHLSDFADSVNGSSDDVDNPAADIPKLFSWRKWVRFVECRKAVLSMYHVPTNDMTYNNGVSNANVFIDNWDKVNASHQMPDKYIDPEILSSMKKVCHFLSRQNGESEEDSIHYPVSFTPFKTYTEHLIANHPKLVSRESKKILSEDFSADSVNTDGNFQWYSDIAEQVSVNIRVIDPARYFDKKYPDSETSSLLASLKTAAPRADLPVPVVFEEDEGSETISHEKMSASQLTIRKPEFDLDREGRSSSIKIFRSLRYWCFHECHRKMAVEEFEEVAMSNFPTSFLWLLSECASMLRTSVKELYFELIFIEVRVARLYPEMIQYKSALQIDDNEW